MLIKMEDNLNHNFRQSKKHKRKAEKNYLHGKFIQKGNEHFSNK